MIQPLENHNIHTPVKKTSDELKQIAKTEKASARDHANEQEFEIDPDQKHEHSRGLGGDVFEKSEEKEQEDTYGPETEVQSPPRRSDSGEDSKLDVTI